MAEAVDARHLEGRSQRLAEATDVTLVVKGTQFPCHSSVLAVTSNFFDSLFNDLPGQAAACGPGPSPRIVLVPDGTDDHPLTAENFAVYLHHLYREPSYELPKVEDALLLLPAADFLGATYFLQKCSKSLAQPQGLGARLKPDTGSFVFSGDRAKLMEELEVGSRYQLREHMAALLPYTMDLAIRADAALVLQLPLDAPVLKVLLEVLASSVKSSGNLTSCRDRLLGLQSTYYLGKLAGWGH